MSSTSIAQSFSATNSSTTAENPQWTADGVFPLDQLPQLPLELVFRYAGAARFGAGELSLVTRRVYHRAKHGLDAKDLEHIPLLLSKATSTPQEYEASVAAYRACVNRLRIPQLTFRLEILASFASRIANFLFVIAPHESAEEFHDIMGRDIIFARESNQSDLQKHLDYALYLVMALNLVELRRRDGKLLVNDLLNFDLVRCDYPMGSHTGNQRNMVDKIKDCLATKAEKCLLGRIVSDRETERQIVYAVPPQIGLLSQLTNLDISYHHLTSLPPEIFKLVNLTALSFWENYIREIPAEIGRLTKLVELELAYNEIASLPSEISQLKSLDHLNLACNKLTTIAIEIMDLKQLTYLGVSRNAFSKNQQVEVVIHSLRSKDPKCKVDSDAYYVFDWS